MLHSFEILCCCSSASKGIIIGNHSLVLYSFCLRYCVFHRTTIMSGAYRLPRGRPDNLLIQPYVDNLEIQADFPRLNPNSTAYSRCNRREIYLKELETLPPPSGGRYRESAPNFYR